MPISSLVLHVRPNGHQLTQAQLESDPRIEVSDVLERSMVVITETKDRSEDLDIYHNMLDLPEVESVNLIYHNHEDMEAAVACNL